MAHNCRECFDYKHTICMYEQQGKYLIKRENGRTVFDNDQYILFWNFAAHYTSPLYQGLTCT